jgi:hypothetical protein
MHLGIEQGKRIMDIQKEFNMIYPYLKLEFFRNISPQNNMSVKTEKIRPEELIHKIIRFKEPGSINIDGKRTVAQLVEDFWENFGLSAFVFRKSGNLWIETSLTDSWTLVRQNKIGESFSTRQGNF